MFVRVLREINASSQQPNTARANGRQQYQPESTAKALFGFHMLKFNSYHINVAVNAWSTKCRVIVCMSTRIKSNLRDESTKPN
jgi:hypothetical protein